MNHYRKRELKQSLLNFHSDSSNNAKQKRIANEVSQLKEGLVKSLTPSLDDLGQVDYQPVQPILAKFDPKIYGNQRRDFSSSWYTGRPWLEYSLSKKAWFCFACQRFNTSARADTCFIKNGYSNWHHAKEKYKGLNKDANSASHIQAMVTWKELQQRLSTTSVSSILQNDQLSKNRYYISSIVDIVHFLCANELPFRGNENEAFQYLFRKMIRSIVVFL
ncbi:Hypothetical predicted protein [Octopus vulgaris]|uniref:TTF-type domain-containing protein n=1 Tax=Octopus vulgaris TaxID=6645 RepID=A0AA36F1E6_OCTVU|nr:Hypothetical predicted protein [Octopus vulgaris]